jgi:hypothetical protein
MIGKFNVNYCSMKTDDNGKIEISFSPCAEGKYAALQTIKEIKKLIGEGKDKFTLTVDIYRNKRSLMQNNLLWALLEIMANELKVTAWDCYLDMLEAHGAKYEYLECTKEAYPTLKEMFRAIKIVEERKGGKTYMCKAIIGSSHYDVKEMTQLIDGVFVRLAELGIADEKAVRYYYDEWIKS